MSKAVRLAMLALCMLSAAAVGQPRSARPVPPRSSGMPQLPPGFFEWRVQRFRLDEPDNLLRTGSEPVTGPRALISCDLAAPMVELLVLSRSQVN